MSENIKLSPKYGLNPSMGVCFICGEDSGEIIIPGLITKKNNLGHPEEAEAPRRAVWHKEPCPKCKEYMKQGIILLSVRNGENGDNPYRTGKFVVIKEEAMKRMISTKELLTDVLKKRMCFIEDKVWNNLGLPT